MSRGGSKRYFIETWGCQMNELDTQRMAGQLMQQGLLPARRAEEADLLLLNSCSVREKAVQKVYSRLGVLAGWKRRRPGLVIGLCGCVAQQEGERALERLPELDFVLGPARVGELTQVLNGRARGERPVITGFPRERDYRLDQVARDGEHKGMVTIIEGCDKKCTFCVVPFTRGPESSRSMPEILREVDYLLGLGFLEIELLGQTVNHWRDPESGLDFADLLHAVASRPGLPRLRFVTSYPRDFTPRMVEQVGLHDNICPYLHLPVQSGSDRVLRLMGRGYTAAEYRELAAQLRRARPGLALSTDLIVGFPGETEEDFQLTLDLLQETRFASVFAFAYSARPGTAALKLPGEVSKQVADERLQRLLALQQGIQHQLNRQLVGSTMELLVTGVGRDPGTLTGRTGCHRIVHFPVSPRCPVGPGGLARVTIHEALPHSLLGRIQEPAAPGA